MGVNSKIKKGIEDKSLFQKVASAYKKKFLWKDKCLFDKYRQQHKASVNDHNTLTGYRLAIWDLPNRSLIIYHTFPATDTWPVIPFSQGKF